jgi:hypothetical protein
MVAFSLVFFVVSAAAANAPEVTACGIVTSTDAQTFIGGPLDVKESAKVPVADNPTSYTSACSYLGHGENFQEMLTASRGLDLTLYFLDTPEATAQLYESSYEQYRTRLTAPNAPYTDAVIVPLDGFGVRAFLVEAVADKKSGYRSALIVFYKGKVAGSIAAWNRPISSVETTKKVLQNVLSKLP